ncbi:hypothetical protein [Desulfofustis glycolicus]|uniref:hypothetical protein n=1 Tax=Desulfofustis glycolicus TaxID=51195 RepID=UPI0011610A95|nr:hypothetical protein [Desulfofustis glycolicus]MCB2217766.1 hypothetical protein [Desulfobulbaceae bacterium]
MIDIRAVGNFKGGASRCLCAPSRQEALEYGMAPSMDQMVTHESAHKFARLDEFLEHSAGSDT